MKKIQVYAMTNRVGSKVTTIIEVMDNATDDEIEEMAREAMFELVEWGFHEVEE